MANETVTLLACGDVGPRFGPTEPYSSLVRPTLAAGDIRFAQIENLYSDRGELEPNSGGRHCRAEPSLASVVSECNFDIVSLASNHGMDWGADALIDTLKVFEKRGIPTAGAGRNIEEARRPVIIERKGLRIAFLAYCSVLRQGYAAGPDTPGIAPLRAHTSYEPIDFQPGVPPRVVTVPYQSDLAAMVDDIKAAKKKADIVIVSLHWGIHFIPRIIADYQRITAQSAFDAGAELILGHHAHIPKGIEDFGGKICFYSLSNFIMTLSRTPESAAAFMRTYGVTMDTDRPNFAYSVDGKRSLIAKAVFSKSGAQRVSFLPLLIDKQLRPEVLRNGDPRFDEMVGWMDWSSAALNHQFKIVGDEVVVFDRAAG